MPLPDLDIVVAIAEAGSLTAAADRLGVPRPTLSRRLSQLEEDMGARLVHRTTRRTVLTEAGHELYRHARPILDAVGAAADAVRAQDGVPRGLLRVSVPGGDGPIANMLGAFAADYPEVRLEAVTAARHVDLVAEGFDVALRAGSLTGPSLISRRLQTTEVRAVASPDYLAQHGTPKTAADLPHHRCLVGFETGTLPHRTWPLLEGGDTPVHAVMAANHPQVLAAAALRGAGIAMLPLVFAQTHMASGALVPVLPDVLGAQAGLWLVYPERRFVLPRVRAFIEHVVAWMAGHPLVGPSLDA